ncbi:hypothetical protein GGS26DRAFT_404009 [Hypomontagnella submonticulosa]|nr:hypothetical protein GGS26DRAFT_404009 [Hypomontagnella submonticulosa]
MNNFGVIELASTKTTNAPGWAYVPDTAPAIAAASLQTGNRKRAARNQAANTNALYADADARQEAKLRREIEALDRDNYHRDVNIPISAKGGKAPVKKHTPNVRKILQSQKTFANHLDDFDALSTQEKANPSASANAAAAAAAITSAATQSANSSRRAATEKQSKSKKPSKSTSRSASISKAAPAVKQEDDVEMTDAPQDPSSAAATAAEADASSDSPPAPRSTILTPYARAPPPAHPLDGDPLLISRVPPFPTDEELKALMAAPPLTYAEARGRWTLGDKRYPPRVFCEMCGYWGRVRCMKCGVRACALDCLEAHREECVTRYGI